ncbi:MAG: SDR family oxidoreductase [Bdellovibrionales bacterium]
MAGRDSLLKLNDKTVAIVGAFNTMTQMILTHLSEQGADVALVGKESPEARRYVEHLNDQREIYPHYGRAGVINTELSNDKEAADLVGRVVHSFGRLDTLVDTLPLVRTDLTLSESLAQESLKFLTSRPRSRLMWLSPHPALEPAPETAKTLSRWRQYYSTEYISKNLTANELVIGVSDEFLLRKSPKSPSIKMTFEELKKTTPKARMLDPSELAAWVMFLSSPLSQAVNGQQLFIDHGLSMAEAGR